MTGGACVEGAEGCGGCDERFQLFHWMQGFDAMSKGPRIGKLVLDTWRRSGCGKGTKAMRIRRGYFWAAELST